MMNTTKNNTLKVGWIPYWNLYPFKHELLHRQNSKTVELKQGVPTQINNWLFEGSVNLAPCSSICLITKKNFEMALPLGVAAKGACQSVYWGFSSNHSDFLELLQQRLKTLKEIFYLHLSSKSNDMRELTKKIIAHTKEIHKKNKIDLPPLQICKESASSVMLTKVLFHLLFGEEALQKMLSQTNHCESTNSPVKLLIGDQALFKKDSFINTIDLSELWFELTNLPFVFAVWQSRGCFLNGWRKYIMETGENAQRKMRFSPNSILPQNLPKNEKGENFPLLSYWNDIYYKLETQEIKGLILFLCLAKNIFSQLDSDETRAKIIRWQELVSSGMHVKI